MIKKKIALAGASVCLAGLIAVGGTFAWLTSRDGAKVNTFSVGNGGQGGNPSVAIQLKEQAFDGADYGEAKDDAAIQADFDAHYSEKDGVITNTLSKAEYGCNQALYLLPSRVVSKDPQVKNNGKNAAYVAIKLGYKKNTAAAGEDAAYTDCTYQDLLYSAAKTGDDKGVLNAIDFDNTNWTAKDDTNTVFYFNGALATGAETGKLFDQVSIANQVAKLYGFQIDVTAYAVQAEGIDANDANAMLDKVIDGTVNQ